MHWLIPAKTFLLGEYVALQGGPAILLTTAPCFEVTLTASKGLQGIHPESPAGRFWLACDHASAGLSWYDPYQGCGGLGASGAQFIGAYLASQYIQNKPASLNALFESYQQYAYQEKGIRSSGYDVLAQSLKACVYIEKQHEEVQIQNWPFQDIGFFLLHTGQKLATHQHLQEVNVLEKIEPLIEIVHDGKMAFETKNSQALIAAVNAYYQQLLSMNRVARHTMEQIEMLRSYPDILAVKGCGAMGADVLCVLAPIKKFLNLQESLATHGWKILATQDNLHTQPATLLAYPT